MVTLFVYTFVLTITKNKTIMKNLETTIENEGGFGSTTTFTKTFDSKTKEGNNVKIKVFRTECNVTGELFKSKTSYALSFNGKELGHYRMDREDLNYYLDFVDKWAHRPELF